AIPPSPCMPFAPAIANCDALAPTPGSRAAGCRRASGQVTASADDGDLIDRERRDQLVALVVHDQHLLEPNAEVVHLAMLRLEGEDHAGLDLDRVVERPD